jgi:hypothetical protein
MIMPGTAPLQPALILYQTEDRRARIQCRFDDQALWLTQAQIAELFQTTPQNVTSHLKAIFAEGELSEAATCKERLQVRWERGHQPAAGSAKAWQTQVVQPVNKANSPHLLPPWTAVLMRLTNNLTNA